MISKADVHSLTSIYIKVFSGVMLTLIANSAIADSVEGMCKKAGEICVCAAQQLKSGINEGDYGLYEAVGAAYIANQASGMNMGDAWDAAINTESSKRGLGFSEALSKTNAIGKAHRKAMKACAN